MRHAFEWDPRTVNETDRKATKPKVTGSNPVGCAHRFAPECSDLQALLLVDGHGCDWDETATGRDGSARGTPPRTGVWFQRDGGGFAADCSMAVLAAAPASASAETLCVNDPSCTGTDKVNLQAALNHAGMTAADDRVEIGAGTYSDGPFVYPQGFLGTVEVVGAGQGDTTLTAGALASNQFVLSLEHAGSVLDDLTIAVTAGDSGARGPRSATDRPAHHGLQLAQRRGCDRDRALRQRTPPAKCCCCSAIPLSAPFSRSTTPPSPRSTLRGQTGIGHDSEPSPSAAPGSRLGRRASTSPAGSSPTTR